MFLVNQASREDNLSARSRVSRDRRVSSCATNSAVSCICMYNMCMPMYNVNCARIGDKKKENGETVGIEFACTQPALHQIKTARKKSDNAPLRAPL